MKITHCVKDKDNQLIGWFESEADAKSFIERYDNKGKKGLYISQVRVDAIY